MQIPKHLTPLRIEKIVTETERAKTFVVMPEGKNKIEYKPGQFFNIAFKNESNETRSYSASSTPEEAMSFTVKAIENGTYSRYLIEEAKVGDIIYLVNVGGKFVLPDNVKQYRQAFFFCAGTGITPAFSIIKYLLAHQPNIEIVLVYSNYSKATTIFYEQLKSLSEKHYEQFKIVFIFSSDDNLLLARLNNFRITELVAQYKNTDWENVLCYACGPVDYMDTVKITMLTEGLLPRNYHQEYFEKSEENYLQIPEDKTAHQVTIQYQNITKTITVQYPETILEAGLQAGLKLPYSCQSGQCGTCTARIKSGEVWLQYNEVLTHNELKEGLTLPCMGFPVDGDVTIAYD